MGCGCSGGGRQTTNLVTTEAQTNPMELAARAHVLQERNANPQFAPGIQQPGDILARVLFKVGIPNTGTGRVYPLMRKDEIWYIAPQDVAANPMWWEPVT